MHGLSLVVVSGGYPVALVRRLLIAVASLVAKLGFSPKQPEAKTCSRKFVWKFDPREQKLERSKFREGEEANQEVIIKLFPS